jgi:ubiquinone biosynthesis monooxygenase Coq7
MNEESQKKIAEIIRVDHAGETGAKVIYEGQILALKLKGDDKTLEIVKEMRNQELKHLDYFSKKIIEHKVRPTLMEPLWKVGGFLLGFATAIVDKKSAMTCTTAVEETIDQHYNQQLTELEIIKKQQSLTKTGNHQQEALNNNKVIDNLLENIQQFRQEEIEHRDIGYENNAKGFRLYKPLDHFIKFTTKCAIEISKKI